MKNKGSYLCLFLGAIFVLWGCSTSLDDVTPVPEAFSSPLSISVISSQTQVTVSWNYVSEVPVSYNIYWSKIADFSIDTANKIENTQSPYIHTNLNDNTTYNYMVASRFNGHIATPSHVVSVKTLSYYSDDIKVEGISASFNYPTMVVSWNAVPYAEYYYGYELSSQFSSTQNITPIKINQNSHSESDDCSDEIRSDRVESTHNIRISAVIKGEEVGLSDLFTINSYCDASTPAIPQGIAIVTGNESVMLSWDPVLGAKHYAVYYLDSWFDDLNKADRKRNITSPHILKGLNNDTTYFFRVLAYNDYYEGEPSSLYTAFPEKGNTLWDYGEVPDQVTTLKGWFNNSKLWLSWDLLSSAQVYYVYDSTSTIVSTENINVTNASTNSYVSEIDCSTKIRTATENFNTIHYRVSAFNQIGEGPLSEEVSVESFCLADIPGVPENIAVVTDNKKITISWDDVAAANSYTLYYSDNENITSSNWEFINNISSPYTLTGLVNEQQYYFILEAKNDSFFGDSSDVFSGIPSEPIESSVGVLSPPSGFAVIAGQLSARLSWDLDEADSSPIEGYNVYRKLSSQSDSEYEKIKTLDLTKSIEDSHSGEGGPYTYMIKSRTSDGSLSSASSGISVSILDGAAIVNNTSAGCYYCHAPGKSNPGQGPYLSLLQGNINEAQIKQKVIEMKQKSQAPSVIKGLSEDKINAISDYLNKLY